MSTITVNYEIEFISGTLKGLTSQQRISYPAASEAKVRTQMWKDITAAKVFGTKSRYVIKSYQIFHH